MVAQSEEGPAQWIPAALADIGIAAIVTDGRGDILFMSPVAEALTGWSGNEAVGRALVTVFRVKSEASASDTNPVAQVLATGEAVGWTDCAVLITRDGRERRLEQGVAPICDAAGAVVAVVLIFCDIGRRQQAAHDQLEERGNERTAELARANAALTAEIARRERAEEARRDLQRRLTSAQEDERRRIARELHDQLGQHLSGLGLGLKVVKNATPHPSPTWDRLHELQALTDRIGRELHQLALELRPTALDDFGLEAALANYTEEWGARAKVDVDFHAAGLGAGRLPAATETALYRVILEALTNVRKHARATRVSVVLQVTPGQVVAIVEDDGCGFDPEPALAGSSTEHRLGILGMRERVALLGGELTIDSEPGRGTTVIANVPLSPGTEEVRDG